jgi:hypothetical protein
MVTDQLTVTVGIPRVTYPTGDFLNAINEVACYFESKREISRNQIIGALNLYCEEIKDIIKIENGGA